jgi:hypothetical protein
MEILEFREPAVERDMDLTREILIKIAADKRLSGANWIRFGTPEELGITGRSAEEVGYHLDMLIEAGFLKGKSGMETIPALNRLTWQGHELLDDIRDDTIWGKAKERAKGLTGIGIGLMWELAKAEIKQKLGLH